jgi:hypothetical protein
MTIDSKDYVKLDSKAFLYKKALRNPEKLVELAESSAWEDNTMDGYEDGLVHRFETNVVLHISDEFGASVISDIYSCMESYKTLTIAPEYHRPILMGDPWTAHISKYNKGGVSTSHTDEDVLGDSGLCTVIIYLNDGYDGGNLGFDDLGIELKPSAGDIIIFPCHYWHYGAEVLSGEKYLSIFRYQFT